MKFYPVIWFVEQGIRAGQFIEYAPFRRGIAVSALPLVPAFVIGVPQSAFEAIDKSKNADSILRKCTVGRIQTEMQKKI